MTKFLIITLALLFSTGIVVAQTPQLAWVKTMFGTTANAPLTALVTDMNCDREGNVYLTGEFHTQINFGQVTLNGNGNDATLFLAKYSPDGIPVWAKKVSPQSPDGNNTFTGSAKIDTDSTGNIYWCANYRAASLDFGNGTTINRACNNGCQEGFLVKLDPTGTIAWTKALHAQTGNTFSVAGVAADAQGRHYLAGSFEGTEVWLQGGANIGGITKDGFYLVQYNASGGAEWIAFLPDNSGQPFANAITIAPDGQRIAVTGNYTDASLNFGNSAITSSAGAEKQFVVWYNTQGQPMGAGTLGSSAAVDLWDIQMDNDYQVWGACDFMGDLTWNETVLNNISGAALVKMSTTALPSLVNHIPFNNNSAPVTTLTLGPNGQFYTGGFIRETVQVAGGNIPNNGCSDLLLTGGNSNTVVWGKGIGGTGCEAMGNFTYGSLMDTDASGNLYIAGTFENSATAGGVTVNGNGLWVGKVGTGTVDAPEPATPALAVSPNPARDFITVQTDKYQGGQIHLMAANGLFISAIPIHSAITELPVSQLSAGVYMVSILQPDGNRMVQKVIIR